MAYVINSMFNYRNSNINERQFVCCTARCLYLICYILKSLLSSEKDESTDHHTTSLFYKPSFLQRATEYSILFIVNTFRVSAVVSGPVVLYFTKYI